MTPADFLLQKTNMILIISKQLLIVHFWQTSYAIEFDIYVL